MIKPTHILILTLIVSGYFAYKYSTEPVTKTDLASEALVAPPERIFEESEEPGPADSEEEGSLKSVEYDNLSAPDKKKVDEEGRKASMAAERTYALEKAPSSEQEAFITADHFTDDDSNALMAQALAD